MSHVKAEVEGKVHSITYDVVRKDYDWRIAVRTDSGGAFATYAEAERVQASARKEENETMGDE